MSELDKHYDVDAGGDVPARPRATTSEPHDEGFAERAEKAAHEARRTAARAAGRVRETVSEGYERAEEWAHDGYDTLSRNAVYARRRTAAELNRSRRSVAAFVEENPIMVGVAGLAAGILIGALLPSTRRENRLLGPYADDLRREGVRYARDVAEQGREAISENLRSVARPRNDDPA